jgi:site-specific DNA recombinase
MPALDAWLAGLFQPEALPNTVSALYQAQPAKTADPRSDETARVLAECDAKLERYRTALEAGTDPVMIAAWTAEVQARKAQALAATRRDSANERLSEQEIEAVIAALVNIRSVLERAHPDDKAAVYHQLNLKLIYKPDDALVSAKVAIDPTTWGYGSCPRGDLNPHALLGH